MVTTKRKAKQKKKQPHLNPKKNGSSNGRSTLPTMRGTLPNPTMQTVPKGGQQTQGRPTRATPPPGVRRQLALQLSTTTRPTRPAPRMELLRPQPSRMSAHPTPPRPRPSPRPRLRSHVSTMQRHQSQHLRPAPPPTHHRNTQHHPQPLTPTLHTTNPNTTHPNHTLPRVIPSLWIG
jgi:hypothetical protein